jgi:formylglycine-generating enzyme required for sulfatase activity
MAFYLVSCLDEDWRRQVENVRQTVARLWERPAHRYAVDHGLAHADRVVGLLGGLTEELMKRSDYALTVEEIYILLAAAYLHAIGLQDEASEPEPQARWACYPELSAEMIYRVAETPEGASDLGLVDDPDLIETIALVVARHQETDYPLPEYEEFPLGNATIRPSLLTALLCLADNLDLSHRRVDLELLKLMDLQAEQALDWWLHYYVSGVQVSNEYVRISYRVPKGEESYTTLLPELVESRVRAEFNALRNTFRLYGVKIDIAPPTVRSMRVIKPMPSKVWTVIEHRLALLRGVEVESMMRLSPLVETVRGLLVTMGYDCELSYSLTDQLTLFRCQPRGGGLRPPLAVGCKTGSLEVADVRATVTQLQTADQQGYIVTETRILPSAAEVARANARVRVFTLAGFYRELLDFRAYVASLVDDYQESELASYYVDLGCVRFSYDDRGQVEGRDRYKPMDQYLDAWLKERGSGVERNHISILSDYGMGKTSFCRQYAAKQGRRWLTDPDWERIPILINLRDYTKTLKVSSLITEALVNQYGIQGATFEAFMRYNADGKLLMFFDGFDEMAQRTGIRTAVENFWELAKVVVPGSKVVLTCRTPYFRTHHEAEALLRGRPQTTDASQPPMILDTDYIDLSDRPNFEIVHLEPFTDDDIQAVLRARFSHLWEVYWAQIQRVYNLPDLARRPVLLDMIARTLPKLKEDQALNAARLYQVYTDLWLERELEKGRTLITPVDRRLFAEELAMEMLRSGEFGIHYSRIPARVRVHFGLEKAEEIDYFEADVRTCNFLNRNEIGVYAFAHKSFMEFLAASRLHGLMLKDQATENAPVRINEEVRHFLHNLFAIEPKLEPSPPFDVAHGKPHEHPAGFVWVPPGEFILGGEYGFDLQVARLGEGFFAAKTLVTNAEFARFVEDGGYATREHWTEDGWSFKEKKGWSHPDYWQNERFNDPFQPVVGVSWHEAVAYCNWLAAKNGWLCRLPTEQEWEKMTRSYDGRKHPWGDQEPTRELCNFEKNKDSTTVVGSYSPKGDSPYGCADTVGNVWEWTISDYGNRSKAVRGGGWNYLRIYVRASIRDYLYPDSRNDNVGFRCVVLSKG